ncbi:MAG: hypothetical protein AB1726_02920 [Planctomycetota bacterium]
MRFERKITNRGRRGLVAGAALLVLCPLGLAIASRVLSLGGERPPPLLERPAAEHERCIKDTPYMRFHHMDLLKELRDAGVRGGAKREVSLASCKGCHTSRAQFCDRCHDRVNLTPDCFGCHDYQ